MKKVVYALAVALLGLVTACTNDDIEITTVGKLYNLNATINTQSLYDEFEMTSNIREEMRERDFAIGVFTFLYDSNGNLVANNASQQFSFNNISVQFTLTEGRYTLVTVETLVDPDNDNESPAWSFQGIEKLSSIQISQNIDEVFWHLVLGVSTSDVLIADEEETVTVIPKAIGSLLQLDFFNFDRSTHVRAGFATNDVISAYKLDPNLSRKDRFITNLTQSGYINVRCNREIDSDNIGSTRYVLESSIDYKFCFVEAEDKGTATWTHYGGNKGSAVLEDGKTYYGGFYYISDTEVPGSYFGDKAGFDEWYDLVTTGSNSNSLIPSAVSMNWGGTVANVQSSMNGYTMTLGSSGRAVLQDDGSYSIAYAGKGKESKIIYCFTSATAGLFGLDIQFEKTSVSKNEILALLNKNYIFMVEDSGSYLYMTQDGKAYVVFFDNEGVWDVGFVDVNYLGISSMKKKIKFDLTNGNNEKRNSPSVVIRKEPASENSDVEADLMSEFRQAL